MYALQVTGRQYDKSPFSIQYLCNNIVKTLAKISFIHILVCCCCIMFRWLFGESSMAVRCQLSYFEIWDRARRRFVCRLTVQTPKGEIINQVIFSLLSFFNQQCIRLTRVSNPFPFTQIYLYYMNSVVRFSNCIYFALRTRYLYKAVNEWKLNCKRRNEGAQTESN